MRERDRKREHCRHSHLLNPEGSRPNRKAPSPMVAVLVRITRQPISVGGQRLPRRPAKRRLLVVPPHQDLEGAQVLACGTLQQLCIVQLLQMGDRVANCFVFPTLIC